MTDELQHYDDWQSRYERAYAAFKRTYELRYPPPERAITKRENTGAVIALAALVLASVIVSGSRTIGEFGGGVIGLAGFVMIEVGIVAYAFIRTRVDYDDTRHQSVKKLVGMGMWLAFFVAVFANVHSTLKAGGVLPEWLDTIVLLVLGFSAPVLAFISGDVLGMLAVMDASRARRAEREYLDAMKLWADGLNASWNAQKQRMGVGAPSVQPVQVNSLNAAVNERSELEPRTYSANSSTGYTKRMDAKTVIREFFESNPDKLNARLDDLVIEITELTGVKVGRTSIHNVRKEMMSQDGLGETQPAQPIDDNNEVQS